MKKHLNYSREHSLYLRKEKIKKFAILFIQIAILAGFLFYWEYAANHQIIDPFIFSSPSRILRMIRTMYDNNDLFIHINTTLFETVLGFTISTVVGTIIAIILWLNKTLQKILDPYIVVLNSLPKVALGPILIIWVGAGTQAIVAMCILITIIVTIISVTNAFNSVNTDQLTMFKAFGASRWQILTKLVLPSSTASLISVLKINVGLAFVGTIMGEYLVSKAGLGNQIIYGGQIFKMDLVMASTALLCVMAGLMYALVSLIEKYFLRKQGRK